MSVQLRHAPALTVSPGGLAVFPELSGWHVARHVALDAID
jgi:hypothetical protein